MDPNTLNNKHLDTLKFLYLRKKRELEKLRLELQVIRNGNNSKPSPIKNFKSSLSVYDSPAPNDKSASAFKLRYESPAPKDKSASALGLS